MTTSDASSSKRIYGHTFMSFQIFASKLMEMVEEEVEKASVRIFDNIWDDHQLFSVV